MKYIIKMKWLVSQTKSFNIINCNYYSSMVEGDIKIVPCLTTNSKNA